MSLKYNDISVENRIFVNDMLTDILILLLGLTLVVLGADYLVDGAAGIARKAGLSEFVIGLTIVGIGTSLPEMVVSFMGAAQGKADVAIGNVIGSNIFNVLLILGLTAMIRPIPLTPSNIRRDIPLNLIVTVLLIFFGLHASFGLGTQNQLTRAGGLFFLLLFAVYMFFSFRQERRDDADEESDAGGSAPHSAWLYLLMVVGGVAGLVIGGRLFLNSATEIARLAGWSDKFIAVTILAGGTSMPELVTCVVAAIKKKGALALGNILGSNISNILLILGGSALICPLSFSGITRVDFAVLLVSAVLLPVCALLSPRRRFGWAAGLSMLACEAAYMTWLIINL